MNCKSWAGGELALWWSGMPTWHQIISPKLLRD
jgi:hypothetical protein